MDYSKLYSGLITFRILNPLKISQSFYTEDHHIVPSCLGGSDTPENMVRLTAREHFIAHRLLSKIHPHHAGLAYAVFQMSRRHNRKMNSREYEILKKTYGEHASKSAKQQWENPEFRDTMSSNLVTRWEDPKFRAIMSSCSKQRWEDHEYKAKMSAVSSKSLTERWEDHEYREMMSSSLKKRWVDSYFREMMAGVNSNAMVEKWKDPDFRAMRSSHVKRQWKDPEFKAKINEALADWREESRGQPWLMRIATKEIWSLAQVFWEHRPNNPEATLIYRVVDFCNIFNEGKNKNMFYKMDEMFKKNCWIPKLDPKWMKEFGHIRY